MKKGTRLAAALVVTTILGSAGCVTVQGNEHAARGTAHRDAPKPKEVRPDSGDHTSAPDHPAAKKRDPFPYNPCSLMPLPEIRMLTDRDLLFLDKEHDRLTSNVADARVSSSGSPTDHQTCQLDDNLSDAKMPFSMGIKQHTTQKTFWASMEDLNTDSNKSLSAYPLERQPLPLTAVGAFVIHNGRTGDSLRYHGIVVLTKYGNMVVIMTAAKATPELVELARQALSTLDGSRYGINK